MGAIIDFQAIHARHLAVFRQFAQSRRDFAGQVSRTYNKIQAIKSNTLGASRSTAGHWAFLHPEFIGGSVDLLI